LTKCQKHRHNVDTTHLELIYPCVPPHPVMPVVQPHPCEGGFIAQEYDVLPALPQAPFGMDASLQWHETSCNGRPGCTSCRPGNIGYRDMWLEQGSCQLPNWEGNMTERCTWPRESDVSDEHKYYRYYYYGEAACSACHEGFHKSIQTYDEDPDGYCDQEMSGVREYCKHNPHAHGCNLHTENLYIFANEDLFWSTNVSTGDLYWNDFWPNNIWEVPDDFTPEGVCVTTCEEEYVSSSAYLDHIIKINDVETTVQSLVSVVCPFKDTMPGLVD